MTRFIPLEASRAQTSEAPAGSRQGEGHSVRSSPNHALAFYLARGLAVMALLGVCLLGAAVVL